MWLSRFSGYVHMVFITFVAMKHIYLCSGYMLESELEQTPVSISLRAQYQN